MMNKKVDFHDKYDVYSIAYIHRDRIYHKSSCMHIIINDDDFANDDSRFTYMDLTGEIVAWGKRNIVQSSKIQHPESTGKSKKTQKGALAKLTFVSDVTNSIYNLHLKQYTGSDIYHDALFVAIANYLRVFFSKRAQATRTILERLYIVFIVPNEWYYEATIIDDVIIPLFVQAGIISIDKSNADRVWFIPELETRFSEIQFIEGSIPKYIERENQCVQYKFTHGSGGYFNCEKIVFQFKEDYYLSMLESRYFKPKIISIAVYPKVFKFDLDDFKEKLTRALLQELQISPNSFFKENVSDLIQLKYKVIQGAFYKASLIILNRNEKKDISDLKHILRRYISGDKIKFAESIEFRPIVINIISELISTQTTAINNFIKKETKNIFFIKNSVFVDPSFSSSLIHTTDDFANLFSVFLNENVKQGIVNGSFCSHKNLSGLSYLLNRRVLIANTMLAPIIIEESREKNKIGLKSFYPSHYREHKNTPVFIVNIDVMSLNFTSIRCDVINREGFIVHTFNIDTYEGLESLQTFMESDADVPSESSIERFQTNQKRFMSTKKKSFTDFKKSLFKSYAENLIDYCSSALMSKFISMDKVGFIICLEKSIMNDIGVTSKLEVSDILNSDITAYNHIGKILLTDQGDEIAWKAIQDIKTSHLHYYLHAHLKSNYVYLKLYQVVDVSSSSTAKPEPSTVLIEDRFIPLDDVYCQVVEKFWFYILSLEDIELVLTMPSDYSSGLDIEDYEVFKEKFSGFLKDKLLDCDFSKYYSADHTIELTKNKSLSFSFQQVLDAAVVPVLKQTASVIASSLINRSMFGNYNDIAKLILTGVFLEEKMDCDFYNYLIRKSISEEFKRLLEGRSHRTKFHIELNHVNQEIHDKTIPHYCYKVFLKGELQIVPSTTYFLYCSYDGRKLNLNPKEFISFHTHYNGKQRQKWQNFSCIIDQGAYPYKFGCLDGIILRGYPLTKKRFRLLPEPQLCESCSENPFPHFHPLAYDYFDLASFAKINLFSSKYGSLDHKGSRDRNDIDYFRTLKHPLTQKFKPDISGSRHDTLESVFNSKKNKPNRGFSVSSYLYSFNEYYDTDKKTKFKGSYRNGLVNQLIQHVTYDAYIGHTIQVEYLHHSGIIKINIENLSVNGLQFETATILDRFTVKYF